MRIGLLSDTHGHAGRTRRAAAILRKAGVEVVIHCGDIGSEEVLIELSAAFSPAGVPVHAVLGNVDPDAAFGGGYPALPGVTLHGRQADLELGGARLAVIHGDDFRALGLAGQSGRYRYVFTGHTHSPSDTRRNGTRTINPGAVTRAHVPSVAVLDTVSDDLRLLALEQPGEDST